MRIEMILLLAAVSALPACTIGKTAAKWPVATEAKGTRVRFVSASGSSSGELLEVRNDGVVILRSDGRLIFAPYDVLGNFEAIDLGARYAFSGHVPPDKQTHERLTMVSHFPQGMTPEIRTILLRNAKQTDLDLLR